MKFDPFGGLLINRGNSILIVFNLYCCSKHKLSAILIANVANLARFVTLTFWFKTLFKFSCVYYLYIWYIIGLPLWDTVSMNLATINMLYFLKQNLSYYTTTYFHITATSPLHFLLYPKWQKRSRSTVLLSFFTWYWHPGLPWASTQNAMRLERLCSLRLSNHRGSLPRDFPRHIEYCNLPLIDPPQRLYL